MRVSPSVIASTAVLLAMAAIGVVSGQADSPGAAPVVVEAINPAPAE